MARQIETMVGLNQALRGHGRIENLFEDADLQMAGYAAALRVLTGYTRIDGMDMTARGAAPSRRRASGAWSSEIIEFAVQVANEHLVPEGLDAAFWERLTGAERFYLKMLDIEATGAKKLDNYQNFAKAFRVADYSALMGAMQPNAARLKTAAEFKRAVFGDTRLRPLAASRAALRSSLRWNATIDVDDARASFATWCRATTTRRDDLMAMARYIAAKRARTAPAEAAGRPRPVRRCSATSGWS